ncbi:MAG: hypothetical protein ABII12_13790 [Planctomycetota bacterium]
MKWFALLLTAVIYGWTWVQISPPEADLPPCHMMPLLLASSIWTAYLFLWRKRHHPTCHCQTCGYSLTGNVSGRCSECGEQVPGEDGP